MTDPLTDAVRRLKTLQEDVERLKAGRDQEGEPRIFLTEQESVDVADVIDIVADDIAATETVVVGDVAELAANDAAAAEAIVVADQITDIRSQGEVVDATWNSATWNVSDYDIVEIVRLDHADVAAASDLHKITTADVAQADTAGAVDTLDISSREIETATYGDSSYELTSYGG